MKVKTLRNILKDYKDNQEALIDIDGVLYKIKPIDEKEVCKDIEGEEYINIDMASDDISDIRVVVCILNADKYGGL